MNDFIIYSNGSERRYAVVEQIACVGYVLLILQALDNGDIIEMKLWN